MRPVIYKATYCYQHQIPRTVLMGRNRVASIIRNARREGGILGFLWSTGGLARKYKIQDGTTEITIEPTQSEIPSRIEVFYVNKNEGWATIVKDMNHDQMGEADFSYHKRDAVEWAKRLQLRHMSARERRGMPPTPIHVFTKNGVERVID